MTAPNDNDAPFYSFIDSDSFLCDRCGGDGVINYSDGDGEDWGEDCPSEMDHLIKCRACNGTGRIR